MGHWAIGRAGLRGSDCARPYTRARGKYVWPAAGTLLGPGRANKPRQLFFFLNLEKFGVLGYSLVDFRPQRNFLNKYIFRAFLEINAKFLKN